MGLEGVAVTHDSMFPRSLTCEVCGDTAIVRAYIPIYKEPPPSGQLEPDLKAVTCTLDCAKCGVRNQVFEHGK